MLIFNSPFFLQNSDQKGSCRKVRRGDGRTQTVPQLSIAGQVIKRTYTYHHIYFQSHIFPATVPPNYNLYIAIPFICIAILFMYFLFIYFLFIYLLFIYLLREYAVWEGDVWEGWGSRQNEHLAAADE